MPVTLWSGLNDHQCYNSYAKITDELIGERVTYFRTVPWATHMYWGGPLTAGLFKELVERLINPEKKSYPLPSRSIFEQSSKQNKVDTTALVLATSPVGKDLQFGEVCINFDDCVDGAMCVDSNGGETTCQGSFSCDNLWWDQCASYGLVCN